MQLVMNQSTSAGRTSNALPARSAADLETLSGVLSAVVKFAPERVSVRQLLFFCIVAYQDVSNTPTTLTEAVALAGDSELFDEAGSRKPMLGRGIERSFNVFLPPTKKTPDALGWLEQVPDEDDRRRKVLRLTPKGREIVAGMVLSMRA